MSLTQSDLDALDRAIASSELEVEQEGRRVRFDTFDGLKARREYVSGVIASGSGTTARPTGSFRFNFHTGRE